MCGIAGTFIFSSSATVSTEQLKKFERSLAMRGPDGSGIWISPGGQVGLVNTRLSILDTSARASQPMHSSDGRYTLVFNGEIYNFAELKQRLESAGHRFRSSGDSEVLLCMYAEYGIEMLRQLRGMFAFAIWDAGEQELFLARDPLGIKPLYYSDTGNSIHFASQVKSLVGVPGINVNPDSAGQVGFLAWGSLPEPYTLYKGIRALPSGHVLRVKPGHAPKLTRYYSLVAEMVESHHGASPATAGEMQERVQDALRESVRYHLVSDVPVTIFLSSGLDSGAITGFASELRPELDTVTLGFNEFLSTSSDETALAEQTSRTYGTRHTSAIISRATFNDHRGRLLESMDQPSIDGVNTYFVSLMAKQSGHKVAISGLGGDELFGGYPSFRQVPTMAKFLHPFGGSFGRSVRKIVAAPIAAVGSPKLAGLMEYGGTFGGAYFLRRALFMPWEIERILGADVAKAGWEELASVSTTNAMVAPLDAISDADLRDHLKVSALESSCYMRNQLLRDADWAGMAHSVEIRVPLVDPWLYRNLAALRKENFTPSKADMIAGLKPPLPEAVRTRVKSGFNVPVREWLQETGERGLRGWAKYILAHFQPGMMSHAGSSDEIMVGRN